MSDDHTPPEDYPMGQSEEDFDSEVDDERAVFVPGDGTKILASNEDYLRNIDEMIEEHCKIPKPKNSERTRGLCMEFCYFDRELEVYTDEEGVEKAINGYPIGVNSATYVGRARKENKHSARKPQNDIITEASMEPEETPIPQRIAPEGRIHSNFRIFEFGNAP